MQNMFRVGKYAERAIQVNAETKQLGPEELRC